MKFLVCLICTAVVFLDVKHVVLQVLLYPGALAGGGGQRFEAMVKRGGPLGELVQWADLSACLIILGHNVTFTSTQHQLYRLPPLQLLLHLHTHDVLLSV